MSSETINPISPERFAAALRDLPDDALGAKISELHNSMIHLNRSNEQMEPFADAGDQDCKEALIENLEVIARIQERVRLIGAELERRGMVGAARIISEEMNGVVVENGVQSTSAADGLGSGERLETMIQAQRGTSATNGRLTDEELRQRLEQQMADDEEGVHL